MKLRVAIVVFFVCGMANEPLIGRLIVRMCDDLRREPQRVAFRPVRAARRVDPI